MMSINETPLPSIPDESSPNNEGILTEQQRRERYRAKLTTHQRDRGLRLKQFAQGKRRYFRGLDLIARRKRAEDIDLMCRFYNGDQYGSYDELGVYNDRTQEGDYAYAIPVLSGHVDQAFLQLFKVRPEYTVTADDNDDPTMKLVADMREVGSEGTKADARVRGALRDLQHDPRRRESPLCRVGAASGQSEDSQAPAV